MIHSPPPRTLDEARKYRYDHWIMGPSGDPYEEGRCAYEIGTPVWYRTFAQCSRRNGHGPEGLYCKQHAKIVNGG